jgi:hypothetical protein
MDRTAYRYDLEYRATVRAEILTLAKGLISGNLRIIAVERKMNRFVDSVEPEIATLLDVFAGINSETDALPIDDERALWNSEALEQEDLKIGMAEECWRERAATAAKLLVSLLEPTS